MYYALQTKDGWYIKENAVLCGKWVDLMFTKNVYQARLGDYQTIKRYKTIVNKEVNKDAVFFLEDSSSYRGLSSLVDVVELELVEKGKKQDDNIPDSFGESVLNGMKDWIKEFVSYTEKRTVKPLEGYEIWQTVRGY